MATTSIGYSYPTEHEMKKLITLATVLALVAPAAYAAPPAGQGKAGSPGQGQAGQSQQASESAAKACMAERDRLGVQAFKEKYGTNPNKANAFGKCVSAKAKQQS